MQADAFPAENSEMIAAIEMLHAFRVLDTQLVLKCLIVFLCGAAFFEIEISLGENGVLLDHLIEDVDVEGQALGRFKLLHKLAADGAPHSVVVVESLDA